MSKTELQELKKFIRKDQSILSLTSKTLRYHLRRFLLFQDAVALAIEERTGHPPPDEECDYTESDRVRAEEILKLYPAEDA